MNATALPRFSFTETFLVMSLIMVIRYVLLSWIFVRLIPAQKNSKIKNDIKWSLLSSIVFAYFSAWIIEAWHDGRTVIYTDSLEYPILYLPLSLAIYLFVQDTYFYWSHRFLHRYFPEFHKAHHESREPSAWTSFSFHPIEASIQALILPVMVFLIPIHWSILFVFLIIMTLFGITNHLGKEIYSTSLESKLNLITANHHYVHHHRMNKNFGLFFTFWDKWMGTDHKKDLV